jgi:Kef-type K+ transport system membrane component KefB
MVRPARRQSLGLLAWSAALAAALLPTTALAAAGASDRVANVAFGLALILVAANLGGHIAVRLGQVAVLGELLAGVLLGNVPGVHPLRCLLDDPSIDVIARLGALVLLFDVGLELTVRDVFAVGRSAIAVAVSGTIFSLACGWVVTSVIRPADSIYSHGFVGAALTATSVGITARVLKDLGKTGNRESRVILSAAIIDDILGLLILTLVSGFVSATGAIGAPSPAALAMIIAKSAAFFALAFLFGSRAAPLLFAAVAKLRTSGAQVAIGLALCFAGAWAADAIGLAPMVGAFTAGLILEDAHSARFVARGERSLRELVEPVSSFLVPVFFVVMGSRVALRSFASGQALGVAVALTLTAVLGKLACALGASGVRRMPVAVGMIPRGEVTLIYASIGGSMLVGGKPILDGSLYSALVFVVIATTLATPAALKWAFQRGTPALTSSGASPAP